MKKTNEVVDCSNDEQMIALGIRLPHLVGRDESVWFKTPEEKEKIKRFKSTSKTAIARGSSYSKFIPINNKLIVYIKPMDEFRVFDKSLKRKVYKTTYSFDCNQSEIINYLRSFGIKNVVKYSWNGQTYRGNELPYWFRSKRYRNQ